MSSTSRFELPSFPTSKVDLVKRYRFYSDLAGFLRAVARLDDTFDSFITGSPFAEGRLIRARRDVSVKVYDARAGRFVRLQEITHALDEDERCADLEVALSYSYLNERYDRVPLEGDVFLVRASIEGDVLTLKICLEQGVGRTEGGMLAHMIVDALRRYL